CSRGRKFGPREASDREDQRGRNFEKPDSNTHQNENGKRSLHEESYIAQRSNRACRSKKPADEEAVLFGTVAGVGHCPIHSDGSSKSPGARRISPGSNSRKAECRRGPDRSAPGPRNASAACVSRHRQPADRPVAGRRLGVNAPGGFSAERTGGLRGTGFYRPGRFGTE